MLRRLLFLLCFWLNVTGSIAQEFKAPDITGKTTRGKEIDAAYFRHKLTLVSFFYIGCAPCMREIPVLNRLQEHYRGKPFRVLGVAPHTAEALRIFDPADTSTANRTPRIQYDVLPECIAEAAADNPARRCHTVSAKFGVSAYPTAVFIGGKGELLMTTEGFPMRENDEETFQEMIRLVDALLGKL
jgi:thiol-disulfide isomerase/thioredoxin